MPNRYLFICGCPRSGTSAMWSVLSQHPDIVIGNEWMAGHAGNLSPELFTRERFFKPTNCGYDIRADRYTGPYVPLAQERFRTARYVGDKIPYLYKHLDNVAERFQGARLVFMLRDPYDVAASYKRRARASDPEWYAGSVSEAVSDWNASIDALRNIPRGVDIVLVQYERFFYEGQVLELPRALDIDPEPIRKAAMAERVDGFRRAAERTPDLDQRELTFIANNADLEGYRAIKAAHARCGHIRLPSVWMMMTEMPTARRAGVQ